MIKIFKTLNITKFSKTITSIISVRCNSLFYSLFDIY